MMSKVTINKRVLLFALGFAVLFALVLWLTIFSRVGSESREFYPPFWSYKAILEGSVKTLLENIGNTVLFILVGIAISLLLMINPRNAVFVGLFVSLCIECIQWFFWLGSFEIDDILHNTLGTVIGAMIINRTTCGLWLRSQVEDRRIVTVVSFCFTGIIILLLLGYQELKWQEMNRIALLNNRVDGTENLLILSPNPVYIGKTDFCITYQGDGCIKIEGESNSRAWIEISRFTLQAGMYTFSGLCGLPEKTIAIELECFDNEQQKYIRLTPDVGPISQTAFELQERTKIRALIGIYPGAEGSYIARPVIYRED